MNSNYEILLWDLYNVLDSDDYQCQGNFKNGKLCGRKCSMKYDIKTNDQNETFFTCKSHFPKKFIKTKKNDFKKKNIDSYLLQDITKAFINKINEIYDENSILKEIDTILIELQPKINPKMCLVSHILFGKLVELFINSKTTVRFVRASNKLKAYTGDPIECKLKGKYAQRKYLSIKYGEWFLENVFTKEQRDIWKPTLTGKLDDRYDVLLMSINSITGIPKKQLKHKNGNELK